MKSLDPCPYYSYNFDYNRRGGKAPMFCKWLK
jgi:hypothetical protein